MKLRLEWHTDNKMRIFLGSQCISRGHTPSSPRGSPGITCMWWQVCVLFTLDHYWALPRSAGCKWAARAIQTFPSGTRHPLCRKQGKNCVFRFHYSNTEAWADTLGSWLVQRLWFLLHPSFSQKMTVCFYSKVGFISVVRVLSLHTRDNINIYPIDDVSARERLEY